MIGALEAVLVTVQGIGYIVGIYAACRLFGFLVNP